MTTGLEHPFVIEEGVKEQGELAEVPYTIIVRNGKTLADASVDGVYDNGGSDTKATTMPGYASITTNSVDRIYVPAVLNLTEEASPYNVVIVVTVNGVVWSIVIPIKAINEATAVQA